MRLELLGKLKKIHLIESRTRELSACSKVPSLATTLSRAAMCLLSDTKNVKFNQENTQ
jgi:hypothetical protein